MPTMRFLLLIALLVPGLALAQAGRFLMAVGDVVVARGAQEIRAGIGTPVESGDTIRVGPNSNAQIRMSDESIVGLRQGTIFRIDEYFYSGAVDGREKMIMSLVKGGMRTVTGLIGRLRQKEKYAVRTATSTVGIRGTHYTLVHCDNDCDAPNRVALALGAATRTDVAQATVGQSVQNGTYGGVTDGRIGVTNNAGDREFGANEYFFVANQDTLPQSLIAPPSFLYDRLSGQTRSKGKKGDESSEAMAQSGLNAESRPSDAPAGPKPSEFVVTEQRTSTGSPTVVATQNDTGALGYWARPGDTNPSGGGAFIPQSALTIGSGGIVTAFTIPENCIGPNDDCTGAPSGTLGTPAQAGSATFPGSTQKVFWGRWYNGTITDDGVAFGLSPTNQAHLMYGPLTPADVIASRTGTLMMQSSLPGLGTTPTNNLGELALGGAFPTITMDFTARTATFSPSFVSFPSQNWSFNSGVAPITVVSGQGAYFKGDATGTCSSTGSGCNGTTFAPATGSARGIFLGPAGDHAGVVLSGAAGTSNFGTVRLYCPTC